MNLIKMNAMQQHLRAVYAGTGPRADVYAQCDDGLWIAEYCDYTETGHGHYWKPWVKVTDVEEVDIANARYAREQSHSLDYLYCTERVGV